METYKGKTVLVTGGMSGMGFATAKLFVEEGARVMVTGRTQKTIEAAQSELGENAIAVYSDAGSLSDIDSLADNIRGKFGKLDVLFVNAGLGRFVAYHGFVPALPKARVSMFAERDSREALRRAFHG